MDSNRETPNTLDDAKLRDLLVEIGRKIEGRGWTLLFPTNHTELAAVSALADRGLIKMDGGSRHFDLSGQSKGAEVICELTASGKEMIATIGV